jgi:hypothetical protein
MANAGAELVGVMLLAMAGSAGAQEPSGRADLKALAERYVPQLMAVRAIFADSGAVCPEDTGILQIANGRLRYFRAVWPAAKLPFKTSTGFKASDDDTYAERIATDDCWTQLAVRQQVRQSDRSWRSLPVSSFHRPSLSEDERQAALRRLGEDARDRPARVDDPARRKERQQANAEMGSLKQGGVFVTSMWPAFDNAPSACVEALGNVVIDPVGVTFLFLPGLPGGVNDFVIERSDKDGDHARFYFTRGDCRFEIVVSASVRNNQRWIARTLQPFDPSKARLIFQRGPKSIPEPSNARPPWLDRTE